jgi:ABC-type lipoprotein release transport system permease subunit
VAGATGGLGGLLLAAGVNQAKLNLPPFARLFLLNDHLELAMHLGPVAAIVLFIVLLTTLASAYPAYRAAKLTPVSAMSHAG